MSYRTLNELLVSFEHMLDILMSCPKHALYYHIYAPDMHVMGEQCAYNTLSLIL